MVISSFIQSNDRDIKRDFIFLKSLVDFIYLRDNYIKATTYQQFNKAKPRKNIL